MPSPRWSTPESAPIAAAIAAAVHEAWDGPEAGASNRFIDALRKMVGPNVLARIELTALRVFDLERRPPEGYEIPPAWAWLTICPACQRTRRTKHTAPQNGRHELQVLRDPEWLARALERHGTIKGVTEKLGCNRSLVAYWIDRHHLHPGFRLDRENAEKRIAGLHHAGEGPGSIARELDTTTTQIRRVLARLGLANRKYGQVYFEREWWRVRLEDRKMTVTACAREAGIQQHVAHYYTKKFELRHAVDRKRRRGRKYPELQDADYLRALLERHGDCYAEAAHEVGCQPTLISLYARSLLGRPAKSRPEVPHARREWWEERMARGMTTAEMAAEAGIAEKTARERLRVLGLLAGAYRKKLVSGARS